MDTIMAEKQNSKVKKTTRSNMISQRLIALFLLAAAIAIYIIALNNNANLVVGLVYVNIPLSGALIAAAVILLILTKTGVIKNKPAEKRENKAFTPVFCAGIMTALALALFAMRYASNQYFIIISVFAVFALVFVFYTYSREFFWLSLYVACGAALLYFDRIFKFAPGSTLNAIGEYASLIAGTAATLLLIIYTTLALKGRAKAKSFFCGSDNLRRAYPFYITALLATAAFAVRELYPVAFSYSLGTLMTAYFVFLLFYTIDLTD